MMLRRCAVLTTLLISSMAWAADEAHDYTCTDSGTRYRIAIFREVPGQELPCSVQTYEHPLGRYSMNWEVPWIVKNQPGFCESKVAEVIEKRRADGWRCMLTKKWSGR